MRNEEESMDFPAFYDATKVGTLYLPNTASAIEQGQAVKGSLAKDDTERVALLLIDEQVDFIHEDGALSVAGAIDDTRRTIEWLFANIGRITTIFASLDSHVPIQIFSPSWWVDKMGKHPEPYTLISHEDARMGRWIPLYQTQWSMEYTERLEEESRKQLMIWPYHTLLGTAGHSITPALYEAIAYHSAVRQAQPRFITKGTIPHSENYSIFEPEVKLNHLPDGGLNKALLDELAEYERIYIAGQAKSHCVLESVTSMMRYFDGKPEIISKIHLLTDGMSSVYSPAIDFEAFANKTLSQYARHGLKLTTTAVTKA
jgi:nicotinamidase/pyrazinamidase